MEILTGNVSSVQLYTDKIYSYVNDWENVSFWKCFAL